MKYSIALMTAAGIMLGCYPAAAVNLVLPTGGKVSVEFIFSDASFSNTLSLVSPSNAAIAITGCQLIPVAPLSGLKLSSAKTSQRGCRVELDADAGTPGIQPFPDNTTLVFNLCADRDGDKSCEDVWSSDPTLNSDHKDHVRTTAIHDADYPNRIFQMAWEDEPNLGDSDFNDFVAVVRVDVDSDGDGLWDDWEKFGIDTNGDGVIDLDLPALGANPLRKDIFLEIDFMDCAVTGSDCATGDTHSHRPKTAATNAVIQAFANAPVANPDGSTGVSMHIDVSNSIAHQNFLNIPGLCFAGGTGIGSFDAVKADPANFGPNNPRRFAYHYVLFTHQQLSTTTSSGCAELPGNDLQVALGGWNVGSGDLDGDGLPDANVGTVQQQAGTLMHELGHNLNLQHGGGDGTNFKPNYLSIMSYAFQVSGIPPSDPDGPGGPLSGRLDYSRVALANLVETALNEPAGIGDGTDNTTFTCPNGTRRNGTGNGAIDWNCDGAATGTSVSVDINGDGTSGTLTGFNDWANIKYDFQSTGSFEDGDHSFSLQTPEIDYPTYLVNARLEGDLNADGRVNCADLAIVRASFGKRSGQFGFDSRADVNNDGVVDVRDLAYVSQRLPAGTACP